MFSLFLFISLLILENRSETLFGCCLLDLFSYPNPLMLMICQAEALTGIKHPILAGQELLKKGLHTKWVIVKMGSRGSILITTSNVSCAPAFKVIYNPNLVSNDISMSSF